MLRQQESYIEPEIEEEMEKLVASGHEQFLITDKIDSFYGKYQKFK